MALYTVLTLGSTVIGGPLVGWISQHWSPRVGLGVAGLATAFAAVALATTAPTSADAPARFPAPPRADVPVVPAIDLGG
jgi:hypothetical protein